MRAFFGRLVSALRFTPAVLCAGTAVCALVRLTVRDRWPVLSMVFYASPPVLMAFSLLAAASAWAMRKSWRPSLGALGGSAIAAAWWLAASLVLAPPPEGDPPRGSLKFMCWNLRRGDGGWVNVFEEIRRHNPDVAWFVEAKDGRNPRWSEELPGYAQREAHSGIRLIARGNIREVRDLVLDGSSKAAEYRVSIQGLDMTVLVVDMDGRAWVHRGRAFEVLDEFVAVQPPGPLVVSGDFNTPRESVFFDGWRGRLTHAFEARGRAMDGTWPNLAPFLSIDQVWVNDRWDVWECGHPFVRGSDHRPVVVRASPRP